MSDFQWMKERFDKVDADNKSISDELSVVRQKVDRHGVYWDIVKWAIPSGGIVAVASWFGFGKHSH